MPKYAFAHYMTTIGTRQKFQTVTEWEDDISEAIEFGIDGFAMNFGEFTAVPSNVTMVANMVTAIGNLGAPAANFYFMPSFDCNGRTPTVSEVQDWFNLYYTHANHFQLGGLPLFTAWQARQVGNQFFVDLKATLDGDTHPFTFAAWLSTTSDVPSMLSLLSGWSSLDAFYPWFPGKLDDTIFNESAASVCATLGKTFIAGQGYGSLGLNKLIGGNAQYVNKYAAEAITRQMTPLVDGSLSSDYLMIGTWNDYGEDHHISPYPPYGPIPTGTTHLAWQHAGHAKVLKYYLDWWKAGVQPTLTTDTTAVFHMRQLGAEGTPPYPYEDYTPDKGVDTVHVATILKAPATLIVKSGTNAPVITEVGAGVTHIRAPAAAGPQVYELRRDGSRLFRQTSAHGIDSPPIEDWSWSRYSEFKTIKRLHVEKGHAGGNAGTEADPWNEADQISWAGIAGGDVVSLAPGSYTTRLTIGASGTPGSSIRVHGPALIDGDSLTLNIGDRSNIRIHDLDLTGSTADIARGADGANQVNIELDSLIIRDGGNDGLQIGVVGVAGCTSGLLVSNCLVKNNANFGVKINESPNAVLRWLVFSGNGTTLGNMDALGIDNGSDGSAFSDVAVLDHANGAGAGIDIQDSTGSAGIYGYRSKVSMGHTANDCFAAAGTTPGILTGCVSTDGRNGYRATGLVNHEARQCTFAGSNEPPVRVGEGTTDGKIIVKNSILRPAVLTGKVVNRDDGGTNSIWEGLTNCYVDTHAQPFLNNGVGVNYATWQADPSVTDVGGLVVSDAGFRNYATRDLRLDGGSPCIGVGTEWWTGLPPEGEDGIRFDSERPDIGAYAFGRLGGGAFRGTALPPRVLGAGADTAKARAA